MLGPLPPYILCILHAIMSTSRAISCSNSHVSCRAECCCACWPHCQIV